MKLSQIAVPLLVVLSVNSGCRKYADEFKKSERQELSAVGEFKALQLAIREEEPGAKERYRTWLERNFIPGRTTLGQVKALFGPDYVDLDRHQRDKVLTIQFMLGDPANGWRLVFDFSTNPTTKSDDCVLLSMPEIGHYICGYCPHVLVDNDGWRLEGKMLPGAIGRNRERLDAMVLPRARICDGMVRVKLANWAPEIEHIDQAELAAVAAGPDEQLDVDRHGTAYLWSSEMEHSFAAADVHAGRDRWRLAVEPHHRVLVLELRNTEKFQDVMRQVHRGLLPEPQTGLVVAGAEPGVIEPVGIKFFRRVVIALPAGCREVRLDCPAGLWWVRRAWLGQGHPAAMVWLKPAPAGIPDELRARDGRYLRLNRDEEAVLTFAVPTELNVAGKDVRFMLRLFGYYEFTTLD